MELTFDGYKLKGVVTSDINGTPVREVIVEPLMGKFKVQGVLWFWDTWILVYNVIPEMIDLELVHYCWRGGGLKGEGGVRKEIFLQNFLNTEKCLK